MIRKQIRIIAFAAALGAAVGGAGAQGAAGNAVGDRAQVEQRLLAVETLLENSSGARQVESSGNAAAAAKRDKAREIYRRARAAFEGGEYASAMALLPQASLQMFEAIRMAAPEQVSGPKARADYDARLESVRALHAAFQRVAAEKPGTVDAAATDRTIGNLIRDSQREAAEGRQEEARATLDRAYFVAKAAISSLRGGDTLVRSLTFANREEEYRYEVDRNDTHQMLLKVLLQDKPRTTGQRGLVDNALKLRARADSAAAGRDHDAAVKLLEESTRELIRAIRGAGVFIPG